MSHAARGAGAINKSNENSVKAEAIGNLLDAYKTAYDALWQVISVIARRQPSWGYGPDSSFPAISERWLDWLTASLSARRLTQEESHWLPGFAEANGEEWGANPIPELAFGITTGPDGISLAEMESKTFGICERWKTLERLENRAVVGHGDGDNLKVISPSQSAIDREIHASIAASDRGIESISSNRSTLSE